MKVKYINKIKKSDRILVTGATGFLGQHVLVELADRGYKNVKGVNSETDLRSGQVCKKLVKDVDVIIHLAAKMGGIGENKKYPGDFFYDNLLMGVQLIDEARKAKVKKMMVTGTVCGYPEHIRTPFREIDFWEGYPSEVTAPYGLAKKSLLVQLQSYRKQYGFNGVFAIITNLYGPGDRSHHVIPDIIGKIKKAKKTGETVVLWGTGRQTREFLYVKDCARALVDMMEKYDEPEPINIGTGKALSIARVARIIAKTLGYEGSFKWDTSKPTGHNKRVLSTARAKKMLGWKPKVSFEQGIKESL